MAQAKKSYIEELSQVELEQIAEIEKVKLDCQWQIDETKQRQQQELADFQRDLTQANVTELERKRNWAQLMADEMELRGQMLSKRLRTTLDVASPAIVDELVEHALPDTSTDRKPQGKTQA
jgi:hypothetical protein